MPRVDYHWHVREIPSPGLPGQKERKSGAIRGRENALSLSTLRAWYWTGLGYEVWGKAGAYKVGAVFHQMRFEVIVRKCEDPGCDPAEGPHGGLPDDGSSTG